MKHSGSWFCPRPTELAEGGAWICILTPTVPDDFFVHQTLSTSTGLSDLLGEKSECDVVFVKLCVLEHCLMSAF